MNRYVRFLAISAKANLGFISAFLAVIFVAGHLFPNASLISTYYGIAPFIITFLCLFAASAALTSQLSLAISMGGNRQDYFWGLQAVPIIYTIYAVVVAIIFRNFSPQMEAYNLLIFMQPLWIALVTYVGFFVGTAVGMITVKHPEIGGLIFALSCGLGGGFMGYNSVSIIVTNGQIAPPSLLVVAICAVAVVLWNLFLKKYISRYSV